jgi:hypothetical protein
MPGPSPLTVIRRFDPGLAAMRQAAVTMAATLASFGTALVIEHFARLSTSIVILAVALTLSIGRRGQRAEHRTLAVRVLAIVVLPLVAVAANEIGTRIFQQPDLGDTLFVAAMSAAIWVRRFGPIARQVATFATFPLVAMLIVPAPVVNAPGSGGDGRWWSALVALIAFAWVTVAQFVAERSGVLVPDRLALDQQVPRQRPADQRAGGAAGGARRTGPQIVASTKMALQMAASLGAAFAVGRTLFGVHWTWTVLTAFIVCSGNRGRGDVVYKAALRLVGAAAGTLAATALSGAFPPGDRWSIVVIFAVLSVALWLRPVNYAFWAGGMTAALALLYGYYGEHGISLLGSRLEAIVIGAAVAVAASWLLLPVRTSDVLRRDVATALKALDDYLAGLFAAATVEEPAPPSAAQARFREAVATLKTTAAPLRLLPAPLRSRLGHLPPAVQALDRCAAALPAVTAALTSRPVGSPPAGIDAIRATVGELRLVNARKLPSEARAWERLADAVRDLPATLDAPVQVPASPAPAPVRAEPTTPAAVEPAVIVRLLASSRRVLAYVNRTHATTFEILSELSQEGSALTYLVQDAGGREAQLTWNRDSTLAQVVPPSPALPREPEERPGPDGPSRTAGITLVELASGRTPSGYPYRLALPAESARRDGG